MNLKGRINLKNAICLLRLLKHIIEDKYTELDKSAADKALWFSPLPST